MEKQTSIHQGPFSKEQKILLEKLLDNLNGAQLQWLTGFLTELYHTDHPSSETGRPLPQTEPVWILYGTHTGNCERLAGITSRKLNSTGIHTRIADMGSFKHGQLASIRQLLVIVSTHGIGEPPFQAMELHEFLHGKKVPGLSHMTYSVLALGDSSYAQFCQTGKDFDSILEKCGAQRLCDRVDCDVDFEDNFKLWLDNVVQTLEQHKDETGITEKGIPKISATSAGPVPVYTRKHPFSAVLNKKINLNGKDSTRETIHAEIGLGNSGITYEPGDALGIYAKNSDRIIEMVLQLLQLEGKQEVKTHKGNKTLYKALKHDYELTPLTGAALSRYAALTGSIPLKKILENSTRVAEYLYGRDVIDLFREIPCKISAGDLIGLLRKNTPRIYSIASSQRAVYDEVHILASVVRYESYGRYREGHCSSYLSGRIDEGDKLEVFVAPNSRFKLPEDTGTPIIMIGAGTGIAPYRAFMQQREIQQAGGRSWLFFGDRNVMTDFLYQQEWLKYLKDGILTRADVAFSRDQDKKVYVQRRLEERGKEIYKWLEDGAHFYVCGDARDMARDVHNTLRTVISRHGNMPLGKAEEYIKSLQLSNRYQTDIY